tara:strand:- start:3291 stop:3611 length:321 start_codon:yes stop_codon:yes gene_type:complete
MRLRALLVILLFESIIAVAVLPVILHDVIFDIWFPTFPYVGNLYTSIAYYIMLVAYSSFAGWKITTILEQMRFKNISKQLMDLSQEYVDNVVKATDKFAEKVSDVK